MLSIFICIKNTNNNTFNIIIAVEILNKILFFPDTPPLVRNSNEKYSRKNLIKQNYTPVFLLLQEIKCQFLSKQKSVAFFSGLNFIK